MKYICYNKLMNFNFIEKPKSLKDQNAEKRIIPESNDPKDMSRRKFLEKAGKAAIVGTVIAAGGNKVLEYANKREEQTKESVLDKVGTEDEKDEIAKELDEENGNEKKVDILDTEIEGVSEKAKDIARELRSIFEKVIGDEKYTPEKLLNDDFYMSIQLRETKYDNSKISNKGAVGVMQNTAISVEDLIRVMSLRREKFKYEGEKLDPEKETPVIAKEILKIIRADKSGDFSRIFGKLYLMVLHNEYKLGKNARTGEEYLDAQERIASSYNGGVTQGKKHKNEWHKESREYAKIVREYTKILGEISKTMKDKNILEGEKNIVTNNNQARMLIAKRLMVMKIGREEMLEEYVKTIGFLERKKGEALSKDEIVDIIHKGATDLKKIRS